jgi:hypothetical protein
VVQEQGDRFRDTLVLTVRGDGVDIPPFFIRGEYGNASTASGRRPAPGAKPVRGMNIPLMQSYIDHIDGYVEEQSLLLMDRLSSHTSKKVLNYLSTKKTTGGEAKFLPILLEPKTAFLVSPLDMGAIAAFKRRYYRFDRSTLQLKENAAYHAWDQVSNDSLRNIALNCGIVGTESLSSIRRRMEKEVKGGVPDKHHISYQWYESWRTGAVAIAGVPPPRGDPLDVPQQIPAAALDGSYWVTYGGEGRET